MSIFSNIHRIAARLVPRQTIEYRSVSSAIGFGGVPSLVYGKWRKVRAHVQPGIISSFGGKNISEKDYKDIGLDFSRNYITMWASNADIATVAHRQNPDQIRVGGRIFNIIQRADWLEFSGWSRCYCVEVMDGR